MPTIITEADFNIEVFVEDPAQPSGWRDLGPFANLAGGDTKADTTKIRAAGTFRQIALKTLASTEDLTLTREYSIERDHDLLKWLRANTGRRNAAVLVAPLDADRNAKGNPDTFTGVMNGASRSDIDQNGNDKATLQVTVGTNEQVS